MTQNMVLCVFNIESEAYQAFAELKKAPAEEKSILSEAVLIKKENGQINVIDSFDTGVATINDTALGGLVGACLGILGGPLGVLLLGSYGALVGSVFDLGDAIDQSSMIEQIAGKIPDDEQVIVALAAEEDESILDGKLAKFDASIVRFDAVVIAEEVEEAREVEAELARQARIAMRKEKTDEFKKRVEERRAKIKSAFEEM